MNFVQYGADLSKIIKNYTKTGDMYIVEYFDESYSQYESLDRDEEKRLKTIMINQALERDNSYNIKNVSISNKLNIANSLMSTLLLSYTLYREKQLLSILTIIALTYGLKCLSDNAEKIRELKKYKLFFEMMNDLEIVNNSKVLKAVEFDNIYQMPFDINTLDRYSYNQVKDIYKSYYKVKKIID